ncbi:hypothetical protein ACIHCQ_37330 [Streptomyces sp. NPDC052236]|uniref:hypothetical protein n=1 Tax=Streptomyces sp. NPDC052236 TaxID=3365686 RepID=UPI0037D7C42B
MSHGRKSGSGRASRRHTAGRVAAGLRSGATARLLSRLSALNVVEGSVQLAAQAFLTALPLLMTIAAFPPSGCRTCWPTPSMRFWACAATPSMRCARSSPRPARPGTPPEPWAWW